MVRGVFMVVVALLLSSTALAADPLFEPPDNDVPTVIWATVGVRPISGPGADRHLLGGALQFWVRPQWGLEVHVQGNPFAGYFGEHWIPTVLTQHPLLTHPSSRIWQVDPRFTLRLAHGLARVGPQEVPFWVSGTFGVGLVRTQDDVMGLDCGSSAVDCDGTKRQTHPAATGGLALTAALDLRWRLRTSLSVTGWLETLAQDNPTLVHATTLSVDMGLALGPLAKQP